MAADGSGGTSHAGRIADRLSAWPGVSKVRADCGTGVALAAQGVQVIHLHTGAEAELRLTRPVVQRMGGALADSGRVTIQPGGEWISVALETGSDVALVVSLASVAIKAGVAGAGTPAGSASRAAARLRVPCSLAAGGLPPDRLAALVTAGGGSPMPLSQFPLLPRGARHGLAGPAG
ncbi:luciferase family protein [Spirillospora sp. CA-255316]